MNEKIIVNIGKFLFGISFLMANLCLFGYFFTKNGSFAEGGVLLLGWGFVINLTVVLLLIIYGIFNKQKLHACFRSILIMSTNIPIALIYMLIGIGFVCNTSNF